MKDKLKALGLEDAVIDSIMEKVIAPHLESEVKGLKDKNFSLIGDKKALTDQLKELQGKLPIDPPSPVTLPVVKENTPDPMLLKLTESIKSIQQSMQLNEQRNIKNIIVNKYLTDARNPNLILSQLDLTKLSEDDGKVMMTVDDGSQVEISAVFDPMRKSEDTNFLFGKPATTRKTATIMGIEIPLEDPTAKIESDALNPWSPKSLNYTQQNEILLKSPELATKLKEAAKSEQTHSPDGLQPPNGILGVTPAMPALLNPYA